MLSRILIVLLLGNIVAVVYLNYQLHSLRSNIKEIRETLGAVRSVADVMGTYGKSAFANIKGRIL